MGKKDIPLSAKLLAGAARIAEEPCQKASKFDGLPRTYTPPERLHVKHGGWFAVARALLNHPHFKPEKPYSRLEASLWLLKNAAYQPTQVMGPTTRGKITVHRGQFAYALRYLAKVWGWGVGKVRGELAYLERWGWIERVQRDDGNLVYRIIGYDLRLEREHAPQHAHDTRKPLGNGQKPASSNTHSNTQSDTNRKQEQATSSSSATAIKVSDLSLTEEMVETATKHGIHPLRIADQWRQFQKKNEGMTKPIGQWSAWWLGWCKNVHDNEKWPSREGGIIPGTFNEVELTPEQRARQDEWSRKNDPGHLHYDPTHKVHSSRFQSQSKFHPASIAKERK